MSEEIIIDGVNVAWCKDYDDGTCCNDDVLTLSCEKANCMYKQLKRLEQENKELKAGRKALTLKYVERYSEIKKYKQTLEEIREMTKSVTYFPQERFELIKDKINEVLKDA